MKKRKCLYVALAAAVLAGCAKENSLDDSGSAGSNVFTCAITEDGSSKTTPSQSDACKSCWEAGDTIRINGVTYKVSSGAGSGTAQFERKAEGPDVTPPFYAFYSDGDEDASWNSAEHTYTLPASYTYTGSGINMPMYAYGEGKVLTFRNLCGVLRLELASSCGLTDVEGITVSSDGQLNGAFTADFGGCMTFSAETPEDTEREISIAFASASPLTESGTDFYIPVAPGSHRLKVKVYGAEGVRAVTMDEPVGFSVSDTYTIKGENLEKYTGADFSTAR